LGRVTPRNTQPAGQPVAPENAVAEDSATQIATDPELYLQEAQDAEEVVADLTELVVLAPPVARTAERVAARFGDLVEAPVLITEECSWMQAVA